MYCGEHFELYITVESLCYTPETNTILHIRYISIRNKLKNKKFIVLDFIFHSMINSELNVVCNARQSSTLLKNMLTCGYIITPTNIF